MTRQYVTGRRERGPGRRVLVGMPLLESMLTEFFVNYDALEIPSDRTIKIVGAYVHHAHNEIVKQALQRRDWEILLLLEQDHIFPRNLIERVASYEEPVTAAPYWLRRPPHWPTALVPLPQHDKPTTWKGDFDQTLTPAKPSLQLQWLEEGKLQRVCSVGMGCTAIQRHVLEDWPQGEPPFQVPYLESGNLITDDVHFCSRARQLGHEVYADYGMPIDHLATRPITLEDHIRELEKHARDQGVL